MINIFNSIKNTLETLTFNPRKIYILLGLFGIGIVLFLAYLILLNNYKIQQVKSESDLSFTIQKALVYKDWNTVRFFYCRPTLSYQEQGDWNKVLNDFIKEIEFQDLSKVTFQPFKNKENSFVYFKNDKLENLAYIKIATQNPQFYELKSEKSFCFDFQVKEN